MDLLGGLNQQNKKEHDRIDQKIAQNIVYNAAELQNRMTQNTIGQTEQNKTIF